MMGLLFNIQKFSLHDGPGIRTVVFFKGCPLYCKWCSNPESQQAEPCFIEEENKNIFDSRYYSVEETLKICLQDRHFYEDSGGGVTLSGGEPLTQPDFAIALLQSLREKGIHTALETSGYAPQKIFSNISVLSDLILFDIKHYDERRHVEGTGVDNGLILANLKNALAMNIQIMPRLPVIPGYNDSLDDAHAFAALLNSLGLKSVQLLPFHQLGERKYDLLNIPYQMRGIPQLHEEDLEEFKEIISAAGIACFI
jgi:pyruvate formate lyase activating enzyme